MAGSASIPGIVSGIDANTIKQLMALEANQQTMLKNQVTQRNGVVTALQKINAKLATLATSAADLAKPTAWAPAKATSTSDKVSVTAANGASTGSTTFQVERLAVAHSVQSAERTAALTDVVVPADADGKHLITISGVADPIDAGDGSLGALVTAINGSDAGLTATAIKTTEGYRLRVTSKETGAESAFTLTGAEGAIMGGTQVVAAGADASVRIGGDTVTSASNTVTGLGTGLTVVLGSATPLNTDITVDVVGDTATMSSSIKGFVAQINAILDDIDTQTAYNASTGTGATLSRDTSVTDVRSKLLGAIFPADGTSMAGAGVQLDRYGNLVFDEKKFAEAYEADPAKVQAMFANDAKTGFIQRYETVAKRASDSIDGTLTNSIKGHQTTIERLEDSVAAWDVRLELREKTLTRQFTALETSMNQWQNIGSWLSGQIGSLPGYSSS